MVSEAAKNVVVMIRLSQPSSAGIINCEIPSCAESQVVALRKVVSEGAI